MTYFKDRPADVTHTSPVDEWEGMDARIHLSLIDSDELAFPADWGGEPELRLEVESLAIQGPPVVTYLSLAETRELIGRLAMQLAAAERGEEPRGAH